jgi:FixJ family two-component response regulator
MKAGLVDCVVTLFRNQVLLIRTRETMERRRLALHREMELSNLGNWYASLAPRERQVMALPVSGLLNKQFGGELGISEIAVKAHRRQVMQKTQANSLPDLGRMAVEFAPTQALSRSMRLN